MRCVYPILILFGHSTVYMQLLLLHAVLKGLGSCPLCPLPGGCRRVCVSHRAGLGSVAQSLPQNTWERQALVTSEHATAPGVCVCSPNARFP